jgi:hypothetical protein
VIQCVVKPKEVVSIFGRCHIQLSADDINAMEKPAVVSHVPEEEKLIDAVVNKQSTEVDDSDEEEEVKEPVPVVKKIVKKAVPVAETPVVVEAEAAVATESEAAKPLVKKVLKKKV